MPTDETYMVRGCSREERDSTTATRLPGASSHGPAPCLVPKKQNSKIFFRHLYKHVNLDEIKKYIATAVCKSRDESNEPN